MKYRLTIGGKVIITYSTLYLLFPYCYLLINGNSHVNYLQGKPDYNLGFLYGVMFTVVIVFVSGLNLKFRLFYSPTFNLFYYPIFNFILSLFFLFLSINFYSSHGLGFRHTGYGLSNVFGGIYLQFLIIYFNIYILMILISISNGFRVSFTHSTTSFIILISRILVIDSSFDVVFISMIILVILSSFTSLINRILTGKLTEMSIIGILGLLFTSFFIIIAIYFLGVANKIGFYNAIYFVVNYGISSNIDAFFARLSIFLHSLSIHFSGSPLSLDTIYDIYSYNIKLFFSRLYSFLGLNYDLQEIYSAARVNALLIYEHAKPKTGASPGLFASSFFYYVSPFGFIITILYLCFVLRIVDAIFKGGRAYSVVLFVYVMVILQPVLDSGPDILNMLDVPFISLFLLFMASLSNYSRMQKK